MPVIKQKQIRHFALDRCFRNKTKRYYIEDLLAECNKDLMRYDCTPVSERTLKYDINEFESIYHVNVLHLRDAYNRVYYRYEDTNFSIQQAPLTDEEMAKLKDTVLMLSRLKGLPQFDWMAETLAEIETKMHLNNHTESIIGFEGNEYLQGLEHLETLFNYIVNKQSIELTYQPFGKPEQVLTLHPYYIKQHNSRWFLLAEDADTGKMMNFALDRIQGIEPSRVAYKETDIDFSEYFDDVIGVSIPQGREPEHVLLRFASSRLPYVLSKPLHPSQKTKDKQQGLIEITVIPNRELEAQILWFGEDVEVLAPEALRLQIQAKIKKMHELYHKNLQN